MHIDLRHLEIIDAIAQTGSMTRAADRLNVTQSALSRKLAEVERRLGTELFLRVNRRLVLSPAGERLLPMARKVLAQITEVEEEILKLARNESGSIRVGTECFTCYHWLTPLLHEFHSRFRDVDVEVAPQTTMRINDALLGGEIDFGLVYQTPRDRRLRLSPLFEDELVIAVAANHRLATKRYVEPSDLAAEDVILHAAPQSSRFAQLLRDAGIQPRKYAQVAVTGIVVDMVKDGWGVAALPRWIIANDEAIVPLQFTRDGYQRKWSIAQLRTSDTSAAQEELLGLIRKRWSSPAASTR